MRTHRLKSLIPALMLAALPVLPTVSHAGIAVGVSITVAPPVLPVYVQPPLPAPGYMWTPGYWAWGDDGYYWVPGTWVQPPSVGLLWTPGYWGWDGGVYFWHGGYWGPHIGFYGGVNYGFGYTGVGFAGGYWRGGAFFYNHAATNFGGVHVTNVYNHTIVNNYNHVSFNGGAGGLHARATAHELAAEHDHHFEATAMQREHQTGAAGNRELRASFNHGRPAIAATSRPGEFSGHGVVGARGSGPHGGPANAMAHNGGPAGHGPENHGGAGPGMHGGGAAPGGGHTEARPMARNDAARSGGGNAPHGGNAGNFGGGAAHGGSNNVGGGAPRGGNAGGGAPHGNVGGGAPHGGNPGGAPRGGGAPHAGPAPHPGGGGHPNGGGGGRKPEGHR